LVPITETEFLKLSEFIKNNYGIFLKKEKMALMTSRLHTVLEKEGFSNYTEYYNYVVNDKSGSAVTTLLNKITTNHTYFMRESDHFDYFRDEVLPILSKSVKDKDLRIWCAACSTGEEPYTLAMILDEYFGREKFLWDTKVLATDISEKVLETARAGMYRSEAVAQLPNRWQSGYFRRVDDEYSMVSDKIKNEVIYRKLNLMDARFPFRKKLHTVFCRNVMIYFDNSTKIELVNKIYDNMEHGGHLFIGHSESLGREGVRFKYVKPAVYMKE
jgi:Methylase of chemotaxis methyl-accepting proteins